MAKQTIAVDLDDVLAASAEGFVAYCNNKWGTNLKVEDYDEDWTRLWDVELTEARRRADELHDSGMARSHKHFEEAEAVLRKLARKYRLVIATSRRMSIQTDTIEWVEQHFKGIFDDIRFAGMWDEITEHSARATKAQLCQDIGADFLIDDQPKHCFAVAAGGVKAILFGDYSWNQADVLPHGVTRVKNWREVEEYFDGLA